MEQFRKINKLPVGAKINHNFSSKKWLDPGVLRSIHFDILTYSFLVRKLRSKYLALNQYYFLIKLEKTKKFWNFYLSS